MTKKVAISVPDEVLAAVDAASHEEGVSRSAVFSAAAAGYLRARRRRAAEERYVQSFEDAPESDEEMNELDAHARSPRAWAGATPW